MHPHLVAVLLVHPRLVAVLLVRLLPHLVAVLRVSLLPNLVAGILLEFGFIWLVRQCLVLKELRSF